MFRFRNLIFATIFISPFKIQMLGDVGSSNHTKCTTLVDNVDHGRDYECAGIEQTGNLCLPLNFTVNSK